MGGTGNTAASNQGAVGSATASSGAANKFGGQNEGLLSTLFGSSINPGGRSTPGTLTQMMNPASLNVSQPTGPYALQYSQAAANNAINTNQNSQAINRAAGQAGFGAGAPSGYTGFLQSQNTQAGNTNAGNLFSQYAGQSYQDALNNFWKATNLAASTGTAAGNQQNTAQGQAGQVYTNLYGTSATASNNTPLASMGKAAGGAVGGKA